MEQVRGIRCWLLLILPALLLFGCGKAGKEEQERSAVDFTVVEERKLPEALFQVIAENRENEIRMTYEDGEVLYLVRGYGRQKTGGYSISVTECAEDADAVYLSTKLAGPSEQEHLPEDPSYPYIVVMIEAREKDVNIE